jgi:cytochrome c oxidase subunit 3
MTTIDTRPGGGGKVLDDRPYHERYTHAPHFRTAAAEFDACKLGMWLFLATEILTFSGMFVAYGIFRMMYPQAWANGSHYLDPFYGGLNTVILLASSFTIAMSIHNAQKNQQFWLKMNLFITILCAIAFVFIKLKYEYIPKWEAGKRPGALFTYPFADNPYEPIWWSVYYAATGIHALHVLTGVVLISWLLIRAQKKHFGPGHYTAVEIVGLFWHIVDIVWIFLFPMLYLID